MKFVRWLGAFGSGSSLSEAADWELSQKNRQVAVEPLWRSRSLIDHAKIGLAVDHADSHFVRGWLSDAWTETRADGTLRPRDGRVRNGAGYRDLDRFLAAWSRSRRGHHGEAIFDHVRYNAVVVKRSATARGYERARRLAANLSLPLEVLR